MLRIIQKTKTVIYLFFLRLFSFLPINSKKIVFDNFNGKGYAGNPKYIAEEILRKKNKYKLIWIVDNHTNDKDFPKKIQLVKNRTVRAAFEIETAKYWIDNIRKNGVVKRKNQIYLQTWHGVIGIKKVEGQVVNRLSTNYTDYAKRDSYMTNFIIAPCERYKRIMEKYFWISNKKIRLFGSPEFDVLYRASEEKKNIIKNRLKAFDKKILLYAPTFRDNPNFNYFSIDFSSVLDSLTRKFGGKWVLAIRLHPNVKKASFDNINCEWINVTDYSDAQEIVMACDAAITDYSSIIFSSAIVHIPSFVHTTDYDSYKNERDFEIRIEKLPFPISRTNKELVENINDYDSHSFNIAYDQFFFDIGMVFDGQSSKRVVDLLLK